MRQDWLWVCVLLAALAARAQAAAVTADPSPPVPDLQQPPPPAWAAPIGKDSPLRRRALAYTRGLVAAANAAGERYQLALLGDSITANLHLNRDARGAWDQAFNASGWRAAALGVPGSTLEELAWRLARGGERFARDPQVVAVLCGINNTPASRPGAKLAGLLDWLRAAYPASAVVVLAPLPSTLQRYAELGAEFRAVAGRHPGVAFSTCGSWLDPRDRRLFKDGLHPRPAGYAQVLSCLSVQAAALMQADAAAPAPAPAPAQPLLGEPQPAPLLQSQPQPEPELLPVKQAPAELQQQSVATRRRRRAALRR